MGTPASNSRVVWCALTPLGKMMINTITTHQTMTRMALIDGITVFTWKQAQVEGYTLTRVRVSKVPNHP